MQQHIHTREVVGGDVLFLAVDFADAVRAHPFPHIQQQRAGAAGEIEHAAEVLYRAGLGLLTVERDNAGEDAGNLLRRVELARFLAGAGGELAIRYSYASPRASVSVENSFSPPAISPMMSQSLPFLSLWVLPSFSEPRLISEKELLWKECT